jgi:hypothetical protein
MGNLGHALDFVAIGSLGHALDFRALGNLGHAMGFINMGILGNAQTSRGDPERKPPKRDGVGCLDGLLGFYGSFGQFRQWCLSRWRLRPEMLDSNIYYLNDPKA